MFCVDKLRSPALTTSLKGLDVHQQYATSKRLLDIATFLVALLVAMPFQGIRLLTAAICPAQQSVHHQFPSESAWNSQRCAATFPCAGGRLQHLHWWFQNLVYAGPVIWFDQGDWMGLWIHLGAAALLLAAVAGTVPWYARNRTWLTVMYRVGIFGSAAASTAANMWVRPGRLPLGGFHLAQNTLWGATCLFWHGLFNSVPFRTHIKVAPIEFLLINFAVLLPHAPHLPPTFALKVISLNLLAGVLLPSALLFHMEATLQPATSTKPSNSPPVRPSTSTKPSKSSPVSAITPNPPPLPTSTTHLPLEATGMPTPAPRPAELTSVNATAPSPTRSAPLTGTIVDGAQKAVAVPASKSSIALSHDMSAAAGKEGGTAGGSTCATAATGSGKTGRSTRATAATGACADRQALNHNISSKGCLYRSRTQVRRISVKVPQPPAALEADPAPLVAAVQGALLRVSAPGAVATCRYAVFRGCIQLMVWVQARDGEAVDSCDDKACQGAARAAAEEVVGAGWDLHVNTWKAGEGVEKEQEAVLWWVEGGRVCLEEGLEEVVVRMSMDGAAVKGGEGVEGCMQRVRVVLVVEGEGGRVLVDEEVQAEGLWHRWPAGQVLLDEECSGGLARFRVPLAPGISTEPFALTPCAAHLLLMPVGDTHGVVLWSTPLLLGAPADVSAELAQLHADMAFHLLSDSHPESTPGAASITAQQLAEATAYQQHLVPLVWDLLATFQADPTPTPQQADTQQQLLAYLQHTSGGLPATLRWLQAALTSQPPAPSSPNTTSTDLPSLTTTPPPPPSSSRSSSPSTSAATQPLAPIPSTRHHAALCAVLRDSFPTSSEESRYQAYLKARTELLDRTLGYLQPLLMLTMLAKVPLLSGGVVILITHMILQALLHMRLNGPSRAACNRQRLVTVLMALHVLHGLPFTLRVVHYPAAYVAMFRQAFTAFGMFFISFFNFAVQQAGFLHTAAVMTVYALHLGWNMWVRFDSKLELATRMAALTAVGSCLSFAADYYQRSSFLRSSAAAKKLQ